MYSLGGSVGRDMHGSYVKRYGFESHCLAFYRLIDMLYFFPFVSIVYFLVLDIFLFCVFFFIFFNILFFQFLYFFLRKYIDDIKSS